MPHARDKAAILVVDDDPALVAFLCESLADAGYATEGTTSPEQALRSVEGQRYDLMLVDIEMPRMRGPELLAAVHEIVPAQLVLLMTAFGSIEVAVAAVRSGACGFIAKPFPVEAMLLEIERALRTREMRREIGRLRAAQRRHESGGFVARSSGMQKALAIAVRAAVSDSNVLVTGERGAGKRTLARYVHDSGQRRDHAFAEVDCAAVPSRDLERALFGVPPGRDAKGPIARPGLMASTEGTLVLHGVGDLTLDLQRKLSTTLEAGVIRNAGSTIAPVKVRIIATSNRSIERMLGTGDFRPDLYDLLNVIRIELPPLRDRREDLLPLVDVLLDRARERHGRDIVGLSAAVLRRLSAHTWPGNVRELAGVLDRAVAQATHDTIVPEDLQLPSGPIDVATLLADAASRAASLADVERLYVSLVVDAFGGNKAAAARALGIDRRTLSSRTV